MRGYVLSASKLINNPFVPQATWTSPIGILAIVPLNAKAPVLFINSRDRQWKLMVNGETLNLPEGDLKLTEVPRERWSPYSLK